MESGKSQPNITIREYFPGAVGKVTELHAVYYHEHWGFDISFETQVGRELSEFLSEYDENRDYFRTVFVDDRFAGAVAIDGKTAVDEGARLRWFIVDPAFQALGLGSLLIRSALDFCRHVGHPKVFLWTFKGLDRAKRLYEREGFVLTKEEIEEQWGGTIKEQKYELILSR
jgi:GNAT superfamily N-acetyltransferase